MHANDATSSCPGAQWLAGGGGVQKGKGTLNYARGRRPQTIRRSARHGGAGAPGQRAHAARLGKDGGRFDLLRHSGRARRFLRERWHWEYRRTLGVVGGGAHPPRVRRARARHRAVHAQPAQDLPRRVRPQAAIYLIVVGGALILGGCFAAYVLYTLLASR